jgi:parallel beta-helix repeat protein
MKYFLFKRSVVMLTIFLLAGAIFIFSGEDRITNNPAAAMAGINSHSSGPMKIIPPIEPEQNIYNVNTNTWYETFYHAIDAASPGHWLVLDAIWHEENVVVNKSVMISGTLTMIHTVDGGSSGHTFKITAEGVTIKWLKIKNDGGYAGVKIESNNNVVQGNIILDCYTGVKIESDSNVIYDNDIQDCREGIRLYSRGNVVAGNIITNSEMMSILLYGATENWLYSNTVIGISEMDGMGIFIGSDSNGNYIYANTIQNHNRGIFMSSSSYNIIHHNNFVNNYASACILGTCTGNQWDNGLTLVTYPPPPVEYPSGGNYWDDNPNCIDNYHGKDQDIPGSDGICDDLYYITSEPGPDEVDRYPLVARWSPMCGNVDGSPDYVINFADIEYLVDFLYGTGTKDPVPPWAADVNCDGSITIGDVALLIDHVNNGTPLPGCCQ